MLSLAGFPVGRQLEARQPEGPAELEAIGLIKPDRSRQAHDKGNFVCELTGNRTLNTVGKLSQPSPPLLHKVMSPMLRSRAGSTWADSPRGGS
ncbi:hypothetical protein [Streptomyces kronopolitis]|uniref:hypothetical protein n=1 Tax=Streptomyces kronopolitis TaxID=1612435 RepID=UPI0036A3AEFC